MRTSRRVLLAGLLLAACARKPPEAPELPLPALRVTLSSEATLGKLGDGKDAVRRPWVGPIVQVLAEETPEAIVPMPQQRIAGARMTADALFERGIANLRAACPQPIQGDRTVKMAKANVQITRAADNHTAARLQLPELWSKIAAEGGGQLFAAAPARDILVWTTSTDEDDQRALRGQARTAFQSRSFPISPAILRWTGNGWSLEDPNPVPPPP
jgi:hypothetical protein